MGGYENTGEARIARRGANKEGGMTDRRGFTLLELLMVVIIIGILASIALPQYFNMSERSRATEALTNLDAIRSSEMRYKAEYSNYTTSLNALDVTVATAGQYWNFSVTNTAAGSNARATRTTTNATIDIDLDSGNTCTSDNNLYRLTAGNC